MKDNILIIVGTFNVGGLETFFYNICKNIVSNKNIVITIVGNKINMNSEVVKNLLDINIHIEKYGLEKSTLININVWSLFNLMRRGNYSVIHANITFLSGLAVFFAYVLGIKKRIVHSHSFIYFRKAKWHSKVRYMLKLPLRFLINCFATDLLCTSYNSGKYLYGKNSKFLIIKNGIDIEKFKFNNEKRNEIRKKLNIENKIVIGHVGRFSREKNHNFIIDVFNEIYKQENNSILILIGDGYLKKEIEQKVRDLHLSDNVLFTGSQNNINNYYQAMDCFLFPSLNEGLGIVAIEAQCSGLPCFISDGVPDEAMVCNTIKIALTKSAKKWADIILEKIKQFERKDCSQLIKESGFDIKNTAKQIEHIYLEG